MPPWPRRLKAAKQGGIEIPRDVTEATYPPPVRRVLGSAD
jgi:hypothetical protein